MSNAVYVSLEENVSEPVWLSKIEPFVKKILDSLEKKDWELSVFFCTDAYIQELNRQYRNIDAPTDILSFEADDSGFPGIETQELKQTFYAGDIVISLETLPVNAKYFGTGQIHELQRLLIHGVLHLSGMDHGEEHIENGCEPQGEMLKLQENLLEKIKENWE